MRIIQAVEKRKKGSEEMWISKKKLKELEERIADLEKQVQSQPTEILCALLEHNYSKLTASNHHSRKKDNKKDDFKELCLSDDGLDVIKEAATKQHNVKLLLLVEVYRMLKQLLKKHDNTCDCSNK